jgi:hypothetical protein
MLTQLVRKSVDMGVQLLIAELLTFADDRYLMRGSFNLGLEKLMQTLI